MVRFLLFISLLVCNLGVCEDKQFVFVVPSFKNENWFFRNLNSLINQTHKNFRIIYINDCSPDSTAECVEDYLRKYISEYSILRFKPELDLVQSTQKFCDLINQNRKFFVLINNETRCGSLANLYRAIQSCDDHEIVVIVDGDDWLSNNNVLFQLNNIYQRPNIWLTHGTLKEYPSEIVAWSKPVPTEVVERNAFREFRCPTHLRTFYAWLFKKIQLDDLLYEGDFFTMTGDMAYMFPMCEMAGERHVFIPQVTYVYNLVNPINDNKVDARLQNDLDCLIRNKTRYQRLPDKE
jgi:glycosyltransferase involved in cell wall biosynthesis